MTKRDALRWNRQRQASVGLFVAALIIAVAAVPNSQRLLPHWILLASAFVVAVSGVILERWRQVAVRRDERTTYIRQALKATTQQGKLPLAETVSLEDLGVRRSVVAFPYLDRAIEKKASGILERGEPLLIVGYGLTGKTRLAAELMRRTYPGREVVIPLDATSLRDLLRKIKIERAVVWLDNLDRYLMEDAIDDYCIRDLAQSNAVIATINSKLLANFQPHGEMPGYKTSVIGAFHTLELRNRRRENLKHALKAKNEQEAAIVREYGIAGYVGGLAAIRQQILTMRVMNPDGFLLLKTLLQWQRTGCIGFIALRC